jgi:hypothetical protein
MNKWNYICCFLCAHFQHIQAKSAKNVVVILNGLAQIQPWGDVEPLVKVCFDLDFRPIERRPRKGIQGQNTPCLVVESCVVECYSFGN